MSNRTYLNAAKVIALLLPVIASFFVFKQYIISSYEFIIELSIILLLAIHFNKHKKLSYLFGFSALFIADSIFSFVTIFEPKDPGLISYVSELCYSLFILCLTIDLLKDFRDQLKIQRSILYTSVFVALVFGYFQYAYLIQAFYEKVQITDFVLHSNFFVYTALQTILISLSFPLSFIVVNPVKNIFLQALNILVFSDFAIRYFTMQGELTYGFSFIEQGWMFAGMLFFIYIYNTTRSSQTAAIDDYTTFNSLRSMLSVTVTIALSLLLLGLILSSFLIVDDANAITGILVTFGLVVSISNHISLLFYQWLQSIFNQWNGLVKSSLASGYADANFQNTIQLSELNPLISNYRFFIQEIVNMQAKLIKSTSDKKLIELASQISHDIRSPVMALKAVSSSIESEVAPEKKQLLDSAVKRITQIADGVLAEYRQKVTYQLPNLQTLDSCIQEVIKEKKLSISESIEINFYSDKNITPPRQLSASEFQRVISNILNNSLEALPDKKGKIDIRLYTSSGRHKITVTDNGIGIPSHLLSTVFKENVTLKKHGTGLGLTHAKKYIESIGGKIEITSVENKYTAVTIELAE